MSEGLTIEGLGVCTTLRGGDSETECTDLAAAVAEEAPTELSVALLLQITLNSSALHKGSNEPMISLQISALPKQC